MRIEAYRFGMSLLPRLGRFPELYEALDLKSCKTRATKTHTSSPRPNLTLAFASDAIYVNATSSIQQACDLAIQTQSKMVVLLPGMHYISETLVLTERHSGLTLRAFDKNVHVSGGVKLNIKKWTAIPGTKIYVTHIPGQVNEMQGLQLNGRRATRARYPNLPGGIEVSPGYGSMISGDAGKWAPPKNRGNATHYTDNTHIRQTSADGAFQRYMIGIGGPCGVYDPPVSYWCSENPSGGGAFSFRTPSGVVAKFPNAPYADASDAVFFVWRPERWANWMFELAEYDGAYNFTFGKGGFQGARGNDVGGDFFIENVAEELDFPGEFFYNRTTEKLYYYPNDTAQGHDGPPSLKDEFVVPKLKVLLRIAGSQHRPAHGISVHGIHFTSSKYTYLEPHSVPSAGDWALERIAAVFVENTTHTRIASSTFTRLDGNALMVSGFNRHFTVSQSDFAYIGGSAIALWGYTNETTGEHHPQAGINGSDGNHPRYSIVEHCSVREVGLYEKQSSFFVQAKTAQSTLRHNVFFNGPRAGINFNDGFGGGDEVKSNLVFSTCRESGDHGPFNSWDRQPFITTVRTGEPSLVMQWREIHQNFFIDNYSPQENVDNDDGSGFYYIHDNFLVYGSTGLKSDYSGHDIWHTRNIYAYPQSAFWDSTKQLDGHEDRFTHNKVVLLGSSVGEGPCSDIGAIVVHSNYYFTQNGSITECGMDLIEWQRRGHDRNSVVRKWPTDSEIIAWWRNNEAPQVEFVL